jgi:hypothetical protein
VYSIGTGLGSTGKGVADGLILTGKSAVGAGGKTGQEEVMKLNPEDAPVIDQALKMKAEQSKGAEEAPQKEAPEEEAAEEDVPEGEDATAESKRRPRKIEVRSSQKEDA